ncbi:MAG TPA: cytidylate kinase family protein [Candidatus Baltobacteraceae bacterium]|nr:cytidylate kinase family protein [Candidatus Baltobacteraceae bacterium]
MIRICISGLTASGKTSLGHMLAEELGITHITKHTLDTYHKTMEEAKRGGERHINIVEMGDKRFAKQFDDELVAMAEKGNCVVTTWLGPWLVKDATLRVWLNAPIGERAARRAKELKVAPEEAKAVVEEKDRLTINAFNEIQNIDVTDHSAFDVELNTHRLSLKEMVAVISMMALSKEKKLFV